MSGCILPLAPEFQDPPASVELAPQITNPSPPLGSVVTPVQGVPLRPFQVTISDPNLGDDLYYRWVIDFPPFSTNTRPFNVNTVHQPTNGQQPGQDVSLTVNCALALAPINQHQVMIIVADRAFSDDGTGTQHDLEAVTPPGIAVVGSWTLNLNCGSP